MGLRVNGLRSVGTLTMNIGQLVDSNGEPIISGNTDSGAVPADAWVEGFRFGSITINADADGNIVFDQTVDVNALYGPLGTTVTPVGRSGGGAVRGRFVGQDADGPLAVLGTYSIESHVQIGHASNNTIVGAFGADRP